MNSESQNCRSQTVSRPYALFIGLGHFLSCKKALIVAALSLIQMTASFGAEERWDELSGMPAERWGLSVVEYEGTLFAIGGSRSSGSRLSTVEQYDPSTDTWTSRADMPTARKNAAAAVVDGKIYVFGGTQAHILGSIKTTEAYDPATDTWTSLTDMPTARFGLAAVPVDGKIYVICGFGVGSFERVVEVYDPATDTWETKAPFPLAIGHGGFAGFDGKIYMFGGTSGQYNDTTATRVYDPVADQWETKASMPRARILSSAAVLDGKFYVLGGNLPAGSNTPATGTVVVYDPGTDTWAEGLSMPTARSSLSAVTLNGKIYAIGGHTGLTFGPVGTVYDTVEVYTPQTDQSETVVLYGNIPDPIPQIAVSTDHYPMNKSISSMSAQQFVTGELGIVSSISLPVAVNGSLTGVLHVEIWDDSSGTPGKKVASVGDIDLDSWTGADLEYQLVTFDPSVTGLEPNTEYYVVFDHIDASISGFGQTYFTPRIVGSEGTNKAAKFQVIVSGSWKFASDFRTNANYQSMEILGASGVEILEPVAQNMLNVSTRGFVSTGEGVMIGGFVIGSETLDGSVLVRGIGPALGSFGVTNLLEDPVIEVYRANPDGSSTLVASNDDWGDNASVAAASETLGAFALMAGSKDAALLLSGLEPGSYTVHLSGKSGTEQVGLMEVYMAQ